MDETIHETAKIDKHVPDNLREVLTELPPISKNKLVQRQNLSKEMQENAKEFGFLKNAWQCLVASFFLEKNIKMNDYIRWCLDRGLIGTKCYRFLVYKKTQPFTHFFVSVTEIRRQCGADKSFSVIEETSKLNGNSAYGIHFINKSKFEDTLFIDEMKIEQKIKTLTSRSYNVAVDKYTKSTWRENKENDEPFVVGFVVLINARQRLLKRRYDFRGRITPPNFFRAKQMDRDSL